MKNLIACILCLYFSNCYSQNELLQQLLQEDTAYKKLPIAYTFKATRLINQQTVETVEKGFMDVRITHRFGAVGTNANGTSSYHNLWGFDVSSDIRIAFEVGITKNLTVGFARSKYKENWELLGKYRVLHQTNDNRIPVSITLFSNSTFSSKQDPRLVYDNPNSYKEFKRRLGFSSQILIARRISSRLSLQLSPTVIHHNFVENSDQNTIFATGFGGRWKFSKRMSVVVDYFFNFEKARLPGNSNNRYNPLGAGFEFDTGGHVFSLMFTNAAAITETEFISNTIDTWTNGGFRFSFNISRNFDLNKKEKKRE